MEVELVAARQELELSRQEVELLSEKGGAEIFHFPSPSPAT